MDAVEAPACYYTSLEWFSGVRSGISVSTDLGMNATYNAPAELVDGDNGTAAANYAVNFTATTTGSPASVYRFAMPMPVQLDTVFLGYVNANTHFSAGTILQLQGSGDGSSWTNLSDSLTYSTTVGTLGVTTVPGIAGTQNANIFPVTKNAGKYSYYRIRWISGGGINASGYSNEAFFSTNTGYTASANPKLDCLADTDGDGIVNQRDLDSDGDGCPDAREAGTYNKSGVSSTGDSLLTNPVGGNGFADILQATADTNAYRYVYTYTYANAANINACADTDSDGIPDIVDIDDDNDGVLDAVESPSCFYTLAEAMVPATVSSSLTLNNIANINDANSGTTSAFTAGNSQNATIIQLSPVVSTNLIASAIRFEMDAAGSFLPTNNPGIQLQGWNGAAWVNLGDSIQAPGISPSAAGGYVTVNVTKNSGVYNSYRLLGVASATANVTTTAIREAQIVYNNYVPSAHAKAGCSADADGDGAFNHLDRDSDNDGCPDARESGTYNRAGVTSTGDSVLTNSVGGNGFADILQATVDTNAYRYVYTYAYAVSGNINVCADTDDDGVPDLVDIDDDNDGVLDAVEAPDCYYTSLEWLSGVRAGISVTTGLAMNATYNAPSELVDGDNGTAAANYAVNFTATTAGSPATVYDFAMPVPVQLDTLFLGYANANTHFNASTVLQLQGSGDGSAWVNLSDSLTYNTTVSTLGVTAVPGVSGTQNANIFPVTKNAGRYSHYRIRWISGGGINASGNSNEVFFSTNTGYVPSANPKLSCATDTDGDSLTNNLDLDSDGDGCPDAREAGTYNRAGVTSMGDSVLTNVVDGNGFADILQATVDTNAYRYVYTYAYAVSGNINVCADTDDDGVPDLVDIDDDNDGVLDAVEAPDCYYTSLEWLSGVRAGISVATGLAMNATYNAPSELVDGDNGTAGVNYAVSFIANTTASPTTVYDFTMPVPVQLDTLFLGYANANTHFNASTVLQLQGSGDGSTWINLSDSLTYNTTVSTLGVTTVPGVYGTQNANIFPVTKNSGRYSHYRIRWISGGGINTSGNSNEVFFSTNTGYVPSANPKLSCATDTDGDSLTNNLDLDSDGDGCPDAREAGTYNQAGVIIVGDSLITNPVSDNGFADVLQATVDTNTYRYPYTYVYATSANVDACADTDGDGIPDVADIDDDNDGVLDAVEAPGCYYTASEAAIPLLVSTSLTLSNIANIKDGNPATTSAFTAANSQNATIIQLTPVNTPNLIASALRFEMNASSSFLPTNNPGIQLQGWNGSSWINLSDSIQAPALSPAVAGGYVTINVTKNAAVYESYRLLGVASAAANVSTTAIREAQVLFSNFVPSAHPKLSCATDTDDDGITNNLDLDSDGDGCPDAKEAGTYNKAGVTSMGDSVLTNPVSSNGFADVLQATADTNAYRYVYTYAYAASENINYCVDTDADGVPDFVDIDDDNDGVLDAVEVPACYYNPQEWLSGVRSGISVITDLAMNATYNAPSELVDGDNGTAATNYAVNFVANTTASPATVYDFTMPVPVRLDTVFLGYANTNTHFNASTVLQLQGSGDGSTWINLSDSLTYNTTVSVLGVTTVPGVSGTQNANIFPVTKNAGRYSHYRIRWISGGGINTNGYSNEVFFSTNTGYVTSANPRSSCTTDTDDDGIVNQLDLDSDGDGCPDAKEAGTYNKAGVTSTGDSVLTNTVSGNGFADVLQAVADTNAYRYTYTYFYALENNIEACTDSDGDGISDLFDIDDDNDGVLDETEMGTCSIAERDDENNRLVWDFEQNLHTLSTAEYNASATQPYSVRKMGPGVVDVSSANVLRFTGATETSFEAAVTAGDYMQYYFTTRSTPLAVDKVVNYTIGPSSLKQGVIISKDSSFSTYTILDKGEVPFSDVSPYMYNDLSPYDNYPLDTNSTYYVRFIYYGLTGSTQSAIDAIGLSFDGISNPSVCNQDLDTDGDGIPNRLDLDSDGDGCYDKYEASVTGSTLTGAYTDSLTVPDNTVGDVGSNGLSNAVEIAADTGIVNYASTYRTHALSAGHTFCTDIDGDGVNDIADIDDDNDGVPDAVESPGCYFTAAEAAVISAVASDLSASFSTTNVIGNAIDGNLTTLATISATAGSIAGKAVYVLRFPTAVRLSSLKDTFNSTTGFLASGATYRIEASMDSTTWTSVSTTQTWSNTNPVTVAINATQEYQFYRIYGLTGNWAAGNLREFIPTLSRYNPSAHPKDTCSNDTDGDGILNHADLDSDNDGCYDKYEAGVTGRTLTGAFTDSLTVEHHGIGDVGVNGLSNAVETAPDTGIVNYTSTYSLYATANNLASCEDTDGDGINDILDIDDDNDGVLDAVESPGCFYTEKEMSQPAAIATTMTIGAGDNVNSLIDTVLTGGFNFTAQALANDTILTFSIKSPARLDTVAIQMDAVTSGTNGFGATGATAKVQGYNGSTWIDVSAAININSTTLGRIYFPITDTGKYLQYRLMGVATANSNTNAIGELLVSTKSPHVASFYPKPTCNNDTDNDGILNHLDLDSDGDGCTDAQEAGTYNMPGVRDTTGTVQNGEHTGTVTSSEVLPHAVIQGPYGANGFADSLQVASPGDTNAYRYTYTYSRATDTSVQACCASISGNTISADQAICYGDAADIIIGSTASASREGATVSYKWMSSTTSASSGFTLNGATGKDYLPGVLTVSTWYKRIAAGDTCASSSDTSSVVAITVTGANAGGPDKNVCLNGTVEMEATGSGSWTQVGTTPSVATIASPSAGNTSISDLSVPGTYRFVWTISDCTDTVSVNVRPLPNGTLSGSVICEGEPATLTFNASSGTGPFNLTINEESYSDIISGTPFAPVSVPATTTSYDLEYISDAYGCEKP